MSNEPGGRKRSAAEVAGNDKEEIARLREELKQEKEQLKQEKVQRKQEKEQLIQKTEQLIQKTEQLIQEKEQRKQFEEKIEQLTARDAAREQQMKQLKEEKEQFLENISIHALLNREKEEEGLFTFECQGNDTSHTTSNSHRPADTVSFDFKLEPIKVTEDMKNKTSNLMNRLKDVGSVIRYQTEADISSYTGIALEDAIKMVFLIKGITLHSRHEQSIFSQRPDHVVVYHIGSNLPVIAIEVKKPDDKKGILTKNTAGQVFDYAVSMKAFGHKAPFVVLSSVQHTHVTWLNEDLPNGLARGAGREESASMNGLSPSVERSAQAVDHTDKTPSPPNLINGDTILQVPMSIGSQAPLSGSQRLMFQGEEERTFCRSSSVYNSSQLARVVYSAILCGLHGLDKSVAKTITRFTQPSMVGTRCCLELSKDCYCWGTISSNRNHNSPLEKRPKKDNPLKKFYVVGIIGSGNTSKVFHALDLECQEYVIKMYVKRFEGKKYLEKRVFEKNASRSVKTEVTNFNLIYPELDVVYRMLNKHHCVVMPFFDPVPKDERESRIEEIQNVLEVFASKNLKYKDEDVRWRHVGLYEGNCILYDLAELERTTDNSFVSEHLENFRSRANMSPLSSGQTFS
jgi:hypothetical protein